jgi:NAD(P)-dependent dehydrogenase (short-subunit alcohol dehydrogenase family)
VSTATAESIFDVRGTRAVVTGSAVGLGFAMAEVLAENGARVMLADIDAERLEQARESLTGRGLSARSRVTDVSDEAQVEALFDAVVSQEGGVDVVFANAGLAAVPGFVVEGGQELATIDFADFDRVIAVNLRGALMTMKHAAAAMKRQRSGRIVVTSSVAGLQAEPVVCYGYISSKAALINVVRQAALDLARYGILVNAICPGPFKGTMIGGGNTLDPAAELEERWSQPVPLKRMATTAEMRGLVLFLASPASSYVTGAAHVIDGGMLAAPSGAP